MIIKMMTITAACLLLGACSKSADERFAEKCGDIARWLEKDPAELCSTGQHLDPEDKERLLKGLEATQAMLAEGERLEIERKSSAGR